MATTIAVSGKGGVGKTTVAALLIRLLKEQRKGPVLAVDADPNSNLNELLGLPTPETIGDIREETQQALLNLPPTMTKETYLSLRIQECILESTGFDLLTMGRQEGPGCYCYINHLLRGYLDGLHRNYRYVVIDNEAGMEHLSRRTTQNVDLLLIVSDVSQASLQAAGRIHKLAHHLKLKIGRSYLLLNRVPASALRERSSPNPIAALPPTVEANLAATGLDLLGLIPRDDWLEEFSLTARPIWDLPEDSLALRTLAGLLGQIPGLGVTFPAASVAAAAGGGSGPLS